MNSNINFSGLHIPRTQENQTAMRSLVFNEQVKTHFSTALSQLHEISGDKDVYLNLKEVGTDSDPAVELTLTDKNEEVLASDVFKLKSIKSVAGLVDKFQDFIAQAGDRLKTTISDLFDTYK